MTENEQALIVQAEALTYAYEASFREVTDEEKAQWELVEPCKILVISISDDPIHQSRAEVPVPLSILNPSPLDAGEESQLPDFSTVLKHAQLLLDLNVKSLQMKSKLRVMSGYYKRKRAG